MKKLLVAAAFAVAAFFPAGALAGTFSGVVVGNGGGSLAVAAKGGLVRTVHSRANVRLGARVHVSGRTVRPFGFASRARIHGVVVRRAAGTTFLAAGRSLLAMRGATAAPSGAVVNAGVAIGGGQLTQQSLQIVGHDDRVTVQAPVTAVGPGTITVTINGRPLTLRLPAGIQLPASLVGQTVTLTVEIEDENEVEVEVEAEDEVEVENEANDDNDRGEHHGGDDGDHSGHGGGEDGDG
jgi:hypothetical protein